MNDGNFIKTQFSQVKSIFRTKKIADEELRSVSFHNNLVARYDIENYWRETGLKTGRYAGGAPRGVPAIADRETKATKKYLKQQQQQKQQP